MSEMDTDYLWLSQQAEPRKRYRLLVPATAAVCAALIAGAAWLYTGSAIQAQQPATPTAPSTIATATPTTQPISADESPRRSQLVSSAEPALTSNPAAQGKPDTTGDHAHAAPSQPQTVPAALRFEPSLRLALTSSLIYNPSGDGPAAPTADGWIHINIDKGDTLSSAFARYNLSYSDSLAIAKLPQFGKYFTTGLRVGDSFGVKANPQGHVLALKDSLGPARVLKVKAGADGYSAKVKKIDLTKRIAYASGVINSSFYRDALEAGLTDSQVMELAGLFKWTIDFAYGIRSGDRFTVIYNELYKHGRKVGNGHILAASFHTKDGLFRALRFTGYENETDYYRPDGSSLKRAFVRVPVDYTRISSPFTLARDHPILDTVRAHEGTDFAAPMGTPIHAAGDGRIVFRGRNGGYGNMIAIDHGRGITTRYGHMSRFASGQSVGTYVKQGQVIGYVGSTGLSTGPHLHYEFRINGVPKNSQTVDLPGAPPLPDEYLDEFKSHVKPLIAQLKAASTTLLARNEHTGIGE